jgi:hypothetical protein
MDAFSGLAFECGSQNYSINNNTNSGSFALFDMGADVAGCCERGGVTNVVTAPCTMLHPTTTVRDEQGAKSQSQP